MKHQSGFGVIAVIVVLVMLATLAGGLVALGSTQSVVLGQDVLAARAEQAARAGTQWGLARAFNTAAPWCDNASFAAPVTATITPVAGFQVTVSCGSGSYNEGQRESGLPPPNEYAPAVVRVYRIQAWACPTGGACPRVDGTASSSAYVERRREAIGI